MTAIKKKLHPLLDGNDDTILSLDFSTFLKIFSL